MVNRIDNFYVESRGNERINEKKTVLWQATENGSRGKGRVRNISQTGMLLETNGQFRPQENVSLTFDSDLGHQNFIPRHGRIVWYKKKPYQRNRYFCGIEFVQPTDFVMERLNGRIIKHKIQASSRNKTLKILEPVLVLVLFALTGYSLWLASGIYQSMSETNTQMAQVSISQSQMNRTFSDQITALNLELDQVRDLYVESESMLQTVSRDLDTTKAILAQTEILLAEAKVENSRLKDEVQMIPEAAVSNLENTNTEFDTTVALLEEKNYQLTQDVEKLQSQLAALSGNIGSIDEGKQLIREYKGRINDVKQRIGEFRRQAQETREAAQGERDRIRLNLGNNGFLTKNGEIVQVDYQKYQAADPNRTALPASSTGQDVNIDVTFFE